MCNDESKTFVGYPCTCIFDYSELFRFLQFPINNVGDPYAPSTYRVNTKDIEQEVLAWFAELTHADPGSFWGYVTNGGSEGNLYGLYLARELMPDGMVYYSEDTHYSVSKNLRMLKMPNIMIRSLPNGEIDYDDLRETIRIHRQIPPIIMANIGTTMKEAIDDIPRIRAMLREMAIPVSYIHCDAALDGMILPFVEDAPQWDFARRHRQPVDQRPQVHRLAHPLRHRPGQESQRRSDRSLDRVCRHARYDRHRLTQRDHTDLSLVRHPPLRSRRVRRQCSALPGTGSICRRSLPVARRRLPGRTRTP